MRAKRADFAALLHPAVACARCEPGLTRWVPCRLWPKCPLPDAGSHSDDVGSTLNAQATHRVEPAQSSALPRKSPLDCLRPVQVETIRKRLRDVELAPGDVRPAVHHLRQDLATVEPDVDPDTARKHRMRDAFCRRRERLPAGRAPVRGRRAVRRRSRHVVAVLRSRHCDRAWEAAAVARVTPCEGQRCERRDERDSGQPDRTLQLSGTHEARRAAGRRTRRARGCRSPRAGSRRRRRTRADTSRGTSAPRRVRRRRSRSARHARAPRGSTRGAPRSSGRMRPPFRARAPAPARGRTRRPTPGTATICGRGRLRLRGRHRLTGTGRERPLDRRLRSGLEPQLGSAAAAARRAEIEISTAATISHAAGHHIDDPARAELRSIPATTATAMMNPASTRNRGPTTGTEGSYGCCSSCDSSAGSLPPELVLGRRRPGSG